MKKAQGYGNYLVRNRFSYCFSMKVPADLQQYIGRKELRYSLKIHTFSYEKGREYKSNLMKKRNNEKKLSKKRINFYLGFASQFFNFAMRNNYIKINPFKGLQIREKKKRPDKERDVFSNEDLKKIFCDSKEYSQDRHKHPHNFWLPLLGLYTGCRIEELSQ